MCDCEMIWFPDKTISNQCRFCLGNQISLQLNVADGISKLKNRQKSKNRQGTMKRWKDSNEFNEFGSSDSERLHVLRACIDWMADASAAAVGGS